MLGQSVGGEEVIHSREKSNAHANACPQGDASWRGFLIFLTGNPLSPEVRAFLEQVGGACLRKACRAAEVRRIVHQVLQRDGFGPPLEGTSPRCRTPTSCLPFRASSLSCRSGRVAASLRCTYSEPFWPGKSPSGGRYHALNTCDAELSRHARPSLTISLRRSPMTSGIKGTTGCFSSPPRTSY